MLNPNKIASPLSRKATLVSVVISQWTARKLDRKITDEINRSHGARADAGRYNKLLIEGKRLERINKIVTQARQLHYSLTKPWCDEGMRILPNTLHQKFASEFRLLQRDFAEAADEFCRDYPSFVEERKVALNGLFDPKDYPSAADIRGKFRLDAKTFPVPDADDFRSDVLDADTVADIRRELTATGEQVLADTVKHNARQIIDVVGHMAERLKAYGSDIGDSERKSYFKDSLVANVRELAEVLPHFNLTNDPELDRLVTRIKRELCVEEAKELRENDGARAVVQKSAESILQDVSALLG